MSEVKSKFIIGIDLGTTNCTMAYTEVNKKWEKGDPLPPLKQFSIKQITESTQQGESLSLPSFLYLALKEENKNVEISWGKGRSFCVGSHARDRGAEVPHRLIASAKSWLCHSGVDRREKILPFSQESLEKEEKLSPLEVSAQLLLHLKEAWDNGPLKKSPFNQQKILITVPASFDPSARQLVQEAAEIANYPEIILLEEPQAAFYSWLYYNVDSWRKQLSVGNSILVVDIGGGTTDFSLIVVSEKEGVLFLERQAVGSHLLLGGDNIDLALAYFLKQKLEKKRKKVDAWQLQSLTHSCRQAKEELFGGGDQKGKDSVDIILHGRGSGLIGGTLKVPLTKEEVEKIVIEGFFPIVALDEKIKEEKRVGIKEVGLPFAKEPRITMQLAHFLSNIGERGEREALDKLVIPTAVLFNGGVLKSDALQERLIKQLNTWGQALDKGREKDIVVLENKDFDFSVSQGATYYGLAKDQGSIRIKSSTSQSYYIGIEEAAPAVPGIEASLKALCVVPFGMEEGSECELESQEFSVTLGEPVQFRFFSCNTPKLMSGEKAAVGEFLTDWEKELTELHSIETVLDKTENEGKVVQVRLKSKVTELGVLELWCIGEEGRRWKLEFDVRPEVLESLRLASV